MKREEDDVQRSLIDYARLQYPRECRWFHHIPNGGARRKVEAAILKGLGVTAGILDLFLPLPIPGGPAGLYMETKSSEGGTSDEQDKFIAYARAVGYEVHVYDNFDDGKRILDDYIARHRRAVNG